MSATKGRAWWGWSKLGATWLNSPLDLIGFLSDPAFQVTMATYLGKPYPLMSPLVGRYFGRDGKRLDVYGANLSSASLHGKGISALHKGLQAILHSMIKLDGIVSVKEAVHFIVNKVGKDPTSHDVSATYHRS